jgi:cytochrome P450
MTSTRTAVAVSDEWQVDHLETPSAASARLRAWCPGPHGDPYTDFCVVTGRDEIEWVLRDWATFACPRTTSEPAVREPAPEIPRQVDARLRRAYLGPVHGRSTDAAAAWAGSAGALADRLLDDVGALGRCDFTAAFVLPYLSTTFFGLVIDAPDEEIEGPAASAVRAVDPNHPGAAHAWRELSTSIGALLADRAARAPRGDLLDGLLAGRVDGRPPVRQEVVDILRLLLLGWLETLGEALTHVVDQLCRRPLVRQRLVERPDLVPAAVDALLRLETPTVSVARVATADVRIGGRRIGKGERVLACWSPADPGPDHDLLDLDEHGTRGEASPLRAHCCVPFGPARTDLRIALDAVVRRLPGVRLDPEAEIPSRSPFGRWASPMPIAFG